MTVYALLQIPPNVADAGDDVKWTDVLESVATGVGVLLTTATLIFLLLQLRAQQKQVNLQSDQSRKSQAEKIVVGMRRLDDTADGVYFAYAVENRSGLPCYYLYFEVYDGPEVAYFQYGTLDDVEAAGTVELSARYRSPSTGSGQPGSHSWPFYRISFMDAANVFWVRDSLGRLEETSSGIAADWPAEGTFAERRAQQVVAATRRIAGSAPRAITPAHMWRLNDRVQAD